MEGASQRKSCFQLLHCRIQENVHMISYADQGLFRSSSITIFAMFVSSNSTGRERSEGVPCLSSCSAQLMRSEAHWQLWQNFLSISLAPGANTNAQTHTPTSHHPHFSYRVAFPASVGLLVYFIAEANTSIGRLCLMATKAHGWLYESSLQILVRSVKIKL